MPYPLRIGFGDEKSLEQLKTFVSCCCDKNIIMLQFEEMGYWLGYSDLDAIRNYMYDIVDGLNRVS